MPGDLCRDRHKVETEESLEMKQEPSCATASDSGARASNGPIATGSLEWCWTSSWGFEDPRQRAPLAPGIISREPLVEDKRLLHSIE